MNDGSRVLITGAGGFSGRWLVDHLRRGPRLRLFGLGRRPAPELPLDGWLSADLADHAAVRNAVEIARPHFVFHLAGASPFASPAEIRRSNELGFENLADALERAALDHRVRMLVVGSAAEFGAAGAARLPIDETAPCEPQSVYGQSKWSITECVAAHDKKSHLELIAARPFNLVGPGLDRRLALADFARQISTCAGGEAEEIRCGNLETCRDYVDVRDAAAAYAAIMEQGLPGEVYHVCSGRSHRLGDLLDHLLELVGIWPRITVEASRFRRGDLPDVRGSHDKLTSLTGWQPRITIEQSLVDLLHATLHVKAAA
jgi:GDP-4-dehydro-6-deoxy-D-mannose reductase